MKSHPVYILLLVMLQLIGIPDVCGQETTVGIRMEGSSCEYGRVRFSAVLTGSSAGTVRWFKQGVLRDLPLGNGLSLELAALRLSDGGSYFCIFTEPVSGREYFSDTVTLNVPRLPVVLPDVFDGVAGDVLELVAENAGGDPLDASKLRWYPSGATANPYSFTVGKADFYVRAEYHDGGCMGVDSTLVRSRSRRLYYGGDEDGFSRVSSAFRIETITPLHRDYCAGETIPFKIKAFGEGGDNNFSYLWYHVYGGTNTGVASTDSFALDPAGVRDAGLYYCEVRNASGFMVTSDTFTLTYTPLHIHINHDAVYADEGEEIQLKASGDNARVLGGDSLSWCVATLTANQWPDLSPSYSCTSSPDSLFRFTAGAEGSQIRVTYTNNKGCTASDSLPVFSRSRRLSFGGNEDGFARVGAAFVVERIHPSGAIQEFCEGDEIGFKASVVGEDNSHYHFYWWKVEQPTNRLIAESNTFALSGLGLSDAGYYLCEAQDENGASAFTDTVFLTPHEVHIPAAVYLSPGEELRLTASGADGEFLTSFLRWYERIEGDTEYSLLSFSGNPLSYRVGSSNLTLRVESVFSGHCNASDSTLVYIRSNSVFRGGADDGYDYSGEAPRIVRPYLPSALCSVSDSLSLQVFALGSRLQYRWELFREEWIPVIASGLQTEGAAGSFLQLRELPEDFRGRFRCRVCNETDTVYSSTVDVTGNHRLKASVSPEIVRFGTETTGVVTVTLEQGVKPWTYRYETPMGVKRSRVDLREDTDLFTVSELGTYTLFYLSDSLGCEQTSELPLVKVTSYKIPEVTLSGGGEVCTGSLASLVFKVTDGIGPWAITVLKDGKEASDLGISFPYTLNDRETALWFTITEGGAYTVGSVKDLNGGTSSWEGNFSGKAVFTVREQDVVRFTPLADNHVGSCQAMNLFSLLEPRVNGIQDFGGTFFCDGIPVGQEWSGSVGTHTIRYVQQVDELGCAGQAEVDVIVDAQPVVSLTGETDLCGNTAGELTVTSSVPDIVFTLERCRTTLSGQTDCRESSLSSVMEYREQVLFLETDSCLHYRLSKVEDSHGCTVPGELAKTFFHRPQPSLRLRSRYPDLASSEWKIQDTVYTWGDYAGVEIALSHETLPFSIEYRNQHITGGIWNIGEQTATTSFNVGGVYRFSVRDAWCSETDAGNLIICPMKAFYFRMKVRLDGLPFDDMTGKDLVVQLVSDGKVTGSATCRVLGNGTVVGQDGKQILSTENFFMGIPIDDRDYHIILRSEGYLAVMSRRDVRFSEDKQTARLIDFTDETNIYFSDGDLSRHMTELGAMDGKTVWGMSLVDSNVNDLISVKDVNLTLRAGRETKTEDAGQTRKNRDKYSEVENQEMWK